MSSRGIQVDTAGKGATAVVHNKQRFLPQGVVKRKTNATAATEVGKR